MQTQRYSISLVAVLMLLFFAGPGYAQGDKTERIAKSYTISSDVHLNFDNKFGKLHIDTHDGDVLEVEVLIKVDLRNESRSQELLDRIEIDVDESSSEISYETDLPGKINNKNGESFSIDYTIKMPRNNPLTAKISFGDMYLDDLTNTAEIEVAYGSLKAKNLTGEISLKLSFSKGEVGELGDGDVVVKYGGLEAEKMGSGELNQQFSDVEIGVAGNLDVESKYGSVKLQDVVSVDGSSNFTDFTIGHLHKSIDLVTSYGNGVEIRKLSRDFESVELRGKFSGYTIYLEADTKANIEVETSFSDFKYTGLPIEMNTMIKEMSSARYKGTLNGGGNLIRLDSSYGDIRLYQ
ncbi:MAG: hypothetical protein RIC80_10885 [Cyclobacteriaceae bacterium]